MISLLLNTFIQLYWSDGDRQTISYKFNFLQLSLVALPHFVYLLTNKVHVEGTTTNNKLSKAKSRSISGQQTINNKQRNAFQKNN